MPPARLSGTPHAYPTRPSGYKSFIYRGLGLGTCEAISWGLQKKKNNASPVESTQYFAVLRSTVTVICLMYVCVGRT